MQFFKKLILNIKSEWLLNIFYHRQWMRIWLIYFHFHFRPPVEFVLFWQPEAWPAEECSACLNGACDPALHKGFWPDWKRGWGLLSHHRLSEVSRKFRSAPNITSPGIMHQLFLKSVPAALNVLEGKLSLLCDRAWRPQSGCDVQQCGDWEAWGDFFSDKTQIISSPPDIRVHSFDILSRTLVKLIAQMFVV